VLFLYSFVPPPSSVDSEADKDLSDLLDFSAVSVTECSVRVAEKEFCRLRLEGPIGGMGFYVGGKLAGAQGRNCV